MNLVYPLEVDYEIRIGQIYYVNQKCTVPFILYFLKQSAQYDTDMNEWHQKILWTVSLY